MRASCLYVWETSVCLTFLNQTHRVKEKPSATFLYALLTGRFKICFAFLYILFCSNQKSRQDPTIPVCSVPRGNLQMVQAVSHHRFRSELTHLSDVVFIQTHFMLDLQQHGGEQGKAVTARSEERHRFVKRSMDCWFHFPQPAAVNVV